MLHANNVTYVCISVKHEKCNGKDLNLTRKEHCQRSIGEAAKKQQSRIILESGINLILVLLVPTVETDLKRCC